MNAEKNIYDKLIEYFGLEEDSINILEETINTDTQIEYFEFSKNYNSKKSEDEILRNKDIIFDISQPLPDKKASLVELAALNNIDAYRTIEKYLAQPNIKLYEWACLALQECKMHLESNLLDESKVLITTGLGGKGNKLRYFIVLFTPDGRPLSKIQQEIITKELSYFLPKADSEFEDILFDGAYASVLAIVPIKINLKELFNKVISECNQLGNFLYNDFIITNMKALCHNEITNLLRKNNIF
ncbi:MAG: hypothetical protein JXA77_07220 [Bacteroidales bacterium]|nr:hypothetical protein [Bacteroidales bacterium]MBN2819666.1 hypothetical protein [Bacteroidales bacterium]